MLLFLNWWTEQLFYFGNISGAVASLTKQKHILYQIIMIISCSVLKKELLFIISYYTAF